MSEIQSSEESRSDSPAALEVATKSLEVTSKAFADASRAINHASEKFASRPPGQRASWLGFMLLFIAICAEIVQAIMLSLDRNFDFSDQAAAIMLVVGGFLVLAAGAFETYYTVKTMRSLEAKAVELESQADEARKESQGLLRRLVGDSNK